MTGLRKRVTVGFLSIVCLLFFSGMVSFLELSHLSRDTGEILKANKRNIELAKEMLDAAHEQNIALIRLSVFGDRSCDSLCRKSMERLENTLLVAQSRRPCGPIRWAAGGTAKSTRPFTVVLRPPSRVI